MIKNPHYDLQYKTLSEKVPLWFKVVLPIGILLFVLTTAMLVSGGAKDVQAKQSNTAEHVVEASNGELYLSIWVNERRTSDDVQLLSWFDNYERLDWLKSETNFLVYDTSHPKYQTDKFRQAFPVMPVVILQEYKNGQWNQLYRVSGTNVPRTALGLYHDLHANIPQSAEGRFFRHRRQQKDDCPDGKCSPTPPPDKDEEYRREEENRRRQEEEYQRQQQALLDEKEGEKEEDVRPFPVGSALSIAMVAAAAGLVVGVMSYKKKKKGRRK